MDLVLVINVLGGGNDFLRLRMGKPNVTKLKTKGLVTGFK
jgi:hypothetical protein